jgi:TPR repeat protein
LVSGTQPVCPRVLLGDVGRAAAARCPCCAADARPDALFYMGVMHLKGYGVRRKSVQRALSYFTLAAHSGHSLGQYNAAVMLLAGKGTAR